MSETEPSNHQSHNTVENDTSKFKEPVTIKKPVGNKNYRRKRATQLLEETVKEEINSQAIHDTIAMQKQRRRTKGCDMGMVPEPASMVDLVQEEEPKQHSLKSTFTTVVEKNDTDKHMLQYIEDHMTTLKKPNLKQQTLPEKPETIESELYKTPEYLQTPKPKPEDNPGNWLTGIVEVELPIEYKLANIEATETARRKILEEKKAKANQPQIQIIPSNYNANYDQHKKTNTVGQSSKSPKTRGTTTVSHQGSTAPVVNNQRFSTGGHHEKRKHDGSNETATDEIVLDRFRKRYKW